MSLAISARKAATTADGMRASLGWPLARARARYLQFEHLPTLEGVKVSKCCGKGTLSGLVESRRKPPFLVSAKKVVEQLGKMLIDRSNGGEDDQVRGAAASTSLCRF
jgi:hypothetical protein